MTAKTLIIPFALFGLTFALASTSEGQRDRDPETDRIVRGLTISPVRLARRGLDRGLVGLGSYIVNAQGGCNDCHTNPSYAPGGDPFQGQPKRINAAHYLAGGQQFGPFTSRNITPAANGLPAGLTFAEFKAVMRTGHDPDDEPGEILQVMPWPVYGEMTDHDLRAVYEFLRAIPHAEPGP
ncbi:MAG TPA: cytochrome C [Thermoanaerobaculia bacterium]|nr:cytochrome C [Thermoanaerobaculia bacterium]